MLLATLVHFSITLEFLEGGDLTRAGLLSCCFDLTPGYLFVSQRDYHMVLAAIEPKV